MTKKTVKQYTQRPGAGNLFGGLFPTVICYIVFTAYLYRPYLAGFDLIKYAVPLNSAVGAVGCFVLSRRWVKSPVASFFAGLVYGYSPYVLSFGAYHALAGVTAAVLPWLFYPAAFWPRRLQKGTEHSAWLTLLAVVLCMMPFVIVAMAFWICAQQWAGPFFPLPLNEKLGFANMKGLLTPAVAEGHRFVMGFYHVSAISLLMGFFLYFAAGKIGIMIIVLGGVFLGFSNPFFQVTPVVWGLVPVLFCSILVGLGMQGFALAGRNDTRWVLICIASVCILAVITAVLGLGGNKAYLQAAGMYGLAGVTGGCIYFMAKTQSRWITARWLLLSVSMGVDIVISAQHIVDKIF